MIEAIQPTTLMTGAALLIIALVMGLLYKLLQIKHDLAEQVAAFKLAHTQQQTHTLQHDERTTQWQGQVKTLLQDFQKQSDHHALAHSKHLQESLASGLRLTQEQLLTHLKTQTQALVTQVQQLTHTTDSQLKEISGQVEKRLTEGFEKTTSLFQDVTKRLALIDSAQKKITELSTNVVSLQEILHDKRSRGAFGEVQLNALIQNQLPTSNYAFQYTLSNNRRVDCALFLPEPTGTMAIDAKFPLESFQKMTSHSATEPERIAAEQQFKQDIKKHIQDVASKYIIPGETADGAMMFIPAEAIFAEIHAHYPDLVQLAQQHKVWLTSPTTMMAIVTTASAVLKDAATRKQVHIIQTHLNMLAKDFGRFEKRMDQLAKHIDLAHEDVQNVKTSAKKLTSRFTKIEQVDVENTEHATPSLEDLN